MENVSGPHHSIGLGVRGQQPPGRLDALGYSIVFTFDKTYNLFKGVAGSWYLIHPEWKSWPSSDLWDSRANRVRIEARKNHITVQVNGRQLASFSDDSLSSGAPYLGLQSPTQRLKFSDIKITPLD